jgi:methionine synthase II (cobalamin-independent)
MSQLHHSDVIGSLLRPKYLTQARDSYAAGQLAAPAFKRIEDRAVDEAIAMQEGIGLDIVTDGEYWRFSFLDQIVSEIDGVAPIEGAPVHFKNAEAAWSPELSGAAYRDAYELFADAAAIVRAAWPASRA